MCKLFSRTPKCAQCPFNIASLGKRVRDIPACQRRVQRTALRIVELSSCFERFDSARESARLNARFAESVERSTANGFDGRTAREDTLKKFCRPRRLTKCLGDIREVEFSARDQRIFSQCLKFANSAQSTAHRASQIPALRAWMHGCNEYPRSFDRCRFRTVTQRKLTSARRKLQSARGLTEMRERLNRSAGHSRRMGDSVLLDECLPKRFIYAHGLRWIRHRKRFECDTLHVGMCVVFREFL